MRWSLAAVALVVAAPLAAAHATPVGAEYEQLVWQDGTFDQTYYQDGYDLHDMWMWEAHDPVLGDGMMLRFHVFGGNTTGIYDTFWIHASFDVNGTRTSFSWWSQDDVTWQGDLPMQVVSNHTAGVAAVPGGALEELPDEVADQLPGLPPVPDFGGGWAHEMQVFIPLDAINATVGDTVSGWTWRTTAERDRLDGGRQESDVDVAPGGFFLTGAPAELEEERPAVPDPGAEPGLLEDAGPIAIFLQGPGRHIAASGEWDGTHAVLRIHNPYNATSQVATVQAPAGAVPVEGSTRQIGPGNETLFLYSVPLGAAPQHLAWDVVTDIGGHARLELDLPAAPPAPAPPPAPKPLERTDPTASPPAPAAPSASPPPIHKDSPGVWIGLAVCVAVMLRRRP